MADQRLEKASLADRGSLRKSWGAGPTKLMEECGDCKGEGCDSCEDGLVEHVHKVETFSKPGTSDVTPADTKKIAPLAEHYLKLPHPFTSCVRDQIKHGLSDDHAKRRCAVLLDKFDPKRLHHSRSVSKAEEDTDAAWQAVGLAEELAEIDAQAEAHPVVTAFAVYQRGYLDNRRG